MKKLANKVGQDKINLQVLKEAEARFRSIVLWSPDAIIVTDVKGKTEYVNPAAERVFNRKLESFIGKDFGLPLVDGESTEIDIFRPGKDPGVGDMHVVEAEWLNKKAHLITIRDITDRKNAEKENIFKGMLLDTAADSIIISDLSGLIVFANKAAEELRGYAGGELIGKDLHKLTSPKYAQLLNGRVSEINQKGELTYESAHFRHDGTSFPIEVHARMIEIDGEKLVLRIGRDITERKRAEDELRASDALLQAAIKIMPVGLWIFDAEGNIKFSSASAQKIWAGVKYVGIDQLGEYKGWRTDNGKQIGAHDWAGARALEKGETTIEEEVEIECFDGTHKIILDSALPLYKSDGSINGAVTINQDITARKKAEDALKNSNQTLQEFAYVASHDLQEPLRMITSYLQLIDLRYKGRLDKDADEFINFAVDGAERMQKMIEGLLSFARVESRGKPLETVNCEDVLKDALENLELALKESSAVVDHDPLPVVKADPSQLSMIFQNLISNSIKFRGKEPPRIHVSAEKKGSEWAFSFKDNGIGIDPQYKEKIFVLFQRLGGLKYPGIGIGLALVKRIVDKHGGRVWVESELGKGATFCFTVPV